MSIETSEIDSAAVPYDFYQPFNHSTLTSAIPLLRTLIVEKRAATVALIG